MDLPQLNLNTLDLSREEVFKNSSRVLYNMSHIQNIILEQGQTDLKLSLGKLKKNFKKQNVNSNWSQIGMIKTQKKNSAILFMDVSLDQAIAPSH